MSFAENHLTTFYDPFLFLFLFFQGMQIYLTIYLRYSYVNNFHPGNRNRGNRNRFRSQGDNTVPVYSFPPPFTQLFPLITPSQPVFHVVCDTSENSWYRLNSASPSLPSCVSVVESFSPENDSPRLRWNSQARREERRRRRKKVMAGWFVGGARGTMTSFSAEGFRFNGVAMIRQWSRPEFGPGGKRTSSIRGFLEGSLRRNNESRSSTVAPRILLRVEEGRSDARMTRSR